MRNIDFSDIHKFIVSIGLGLIFLAIVVPWLFFRETFDLLLESDKIDKLTKVAKSVILQRQEKVFSIINLLPWLSLLLFVIGTTMIIYGLVKWSKKQKVVDEHQEILLSKTKKEIETMTLDEKVKSVVKETQEEEETQGDFNNVEVENKNNYELYQQHQNIVTKYFNVESRIFEKLKNSYSNHYEIKPNMKIGKFEYDIIMTSKFNNDLIIEIKYYQKFNSVLNIKNTIEQVRLLERNYIKYLGRKVTAKIVLVLSPEVYNKLEQNKDINQFLNHNNLLIIGEESLQALEGDFLKLNNDV